MCLHFLWNYKRKIKYADRPKVAKNLLKEKIPIEKIAKITGLSEEEIRKIKT